MGNLDSLKKQVTDIRESQQKNLEMAAIDFEAMPEENSVYDINQNSVVYEGEGGKESIFDKIPDNKKPADLA